MSDARKLRSLAADIAHVSLPTVESPAAQRVLDEISEWLQEANDECLMCAITLERAAKAGKETREAKGKEGDECSV